MRHIIYGAGAIGGTIGARLHQAGKSVLLIARGEHLAELRDHGVSFKSPDGHQQLRIPVCGGPEEITFQAGDIVYCTMKTQHSQPAMESLYQAAGPDIPVICCQNGVENERLAARLFRHVYGMVVMLPASHMQPGEIIHHASSAREGYTGGILDAGRFPSGLDEIITRVASDLSEAGFSCTADAAAMRWKYAKLLQNLGNAMQAVIGLKQDGRALMSLMIHEALTCFRAGGIDCASKEEVASRRQGQLEMEPVAGFERGGGSSWQSIMRGTGSIEAHYLNGEICLLGNLHGVATPANEVMRRLAVKVAAGEIAPGSLSVAEVTSEIDKETALSGSQQPVA